ncbi:MAG: NusG domain II-containing protein [Gammaproteobacteria bacterium]|jgi:hypothetical protein
MTRADLVAVILAVALLPVLYLHFWSGGGFAEQVRIQEGNQPPHYYSLARDQRIRVHGPLGDSVLEILHGRVRFVSSPCRNKICVHSGWLSRAGESTACLPNRVSVQIIGQDPRFDAINS